ncbi:MAG: hypothetical protein JRH16_07845 [Deltaproteobacteria bacterium]|nr:hypothetical protein [Deltaproteobacteria bacterium]
MLGGVAILLAIALTAAERTQLLTSLGVQSALLACLGPAAGALAIDAVECQGRLGGGLYCRKVA